MSKRSVVYLLILSFSVVCLGCGALTKSQVKEVNKFATAAKDCPQLPGKVITEHAKIRKTRLVIQASTDMSGAAALNGINSALRQEAKLAKRGAGTDAALKVLKDYADLLVKLTSDDFTTALQASCETLGSSIDKGIKEYNTLQKASLSTFGSAVAAAVRGVGGMYIRAQQEEALKKAVVSADPVIRPMTATIEETMALYLNDNQLAGVKLPAADKAPPALTAGGLLANEKDDMTHLYTTTGQYNGKQPLTLALTVADEIEDIDTTAQLAAAAIEAAASYRVAHAALADMVSKKQDLPSEIAEVQVLADEVKAAMDLKDKLDKK